MDLLKRVIFYDPRTHFSGKIDTHFPYHKSLFSTPQERGLPLGDLVSQLLGNFYLHEFDHFVKHTIHIKQYGRYMDDMIFFHPDKKVLEDVIVQVRAFLHGTLGLTLHEGKIVLNRCEQGILFLGAYIKPWRTYIGNRPKKNMFADIYVGILPSRERYQSYLGLTEHFDTYRLQKMYRDAVIVLGL